MVYLYDTQTPRFIYLHNTSFNDVSIIILLITCIFNQFFFSKNNIEIAKEKEKMLRVYKYILRCVFELIFLN